MFLTVEKFVVVLHVASCFYMTGVIFLIQKIHYPCFLLIEKKEFSSFHRQHCKNMTWLVGPVMGVELLSGLWIAWYGNSWALVNIFGVILTWGVTFFLSVPLHQRLSKGFDNDVWSQLLRTNWLRTFTWGIRSFIFLFLFKSLFY